MNLESDQQPVALITGASGGIGEAFAHELARDGFRLVLVARTANELSRVAGDLASENTIEPICIGMDLSQHGAAAALSAQIAELGLTPQVVVNNAGFGLMGKTLALDVDEQVEMINLNITALTELSVIYGRQMASCGKGGIINVTSVAGSLPGPNMSVYYASKAYILRFTEALSAELKGSGVQVTAVAPGVTRTGFHKRAGMEQSMLMKWSIPMSAEAVARIGYQGFLRKRRVVTTGFFNKFAMLCSLLVPNMILLPVTGWLHTKAASGAELSQEPLTAKRQGDE
ncbi:MAG: SDR family oxidoreductase [Pseudomonadota bacterium]